MREDYCIDFWALRENTTDFRVIGLLFECLYQLWKEIRSFHQTSSQLVYINIYSKNITKIL